MVIGELLAPWDLNLIYLESRRNWIIRNYYIYLGDVTDFVVRCNAMDDGRFGGFRIQIWTRELII